MCYSEGHRNDITPLCIALPQTSAYVKSYDDNETKWMYFIIDDEFLK